MCEVVKINVGGWLFQADRRTFERSSHLKTLLSSELADDSTDADGSLFIDRDPALFEQVLKLLRGYRFHRREDLIWEEVKNEADFYQVPGLEALAPETPVIVIVPEETFAVRRFSLTPYLTKRGKQHYAISQSDIRGLPSDLAGKVFALAPYAGSPYVLDVQYVTAAGFEPKNIEDDNDEDKWIYECKEKVVFYPKTVGTTLEVPKLFNESLREDCPHWIRIMCRFKVDE